MRSDPIEEKFHPRLMRWFKKNIGTPTKVQRSAWTLVQEGKNVLVLSPTGSGKTLAAIIPLIDPIIKGKVDRSRTSIVYITPMKALGADIVKTLNNLSEGVGRIKGKKERKWGRGRRRKDEILPNARLKVGIRTGDVPQSERRRMLIDPPDLLVITPENLLLMLCSKARDTLTSVSSIIVDEVHEMVPGKRGALLSLTLELLTDLVVNHDGPEPLRIGLSATVRPETIAARYLGGQFSTMDPRPVEIIREDARKEMIIEFKTLLSSHERDQEQRERIMDDLGKMMDEDKGPLVIFHNTRRSAEEMAYALVQRGHPAVMPHHGSLGADVRQMAEEGLKSGKLKAIVSSTSLELGIDIGKVDTVCQVASPKDPLKMLQRFGRSGHGLGRTSHGVIYPIDGIDLIESLSVARTASKGKLERLKAPKDPFDVLSQFAIGASLNERGIKLDTLWELCRRAYPFQKLRSRDLKDILCLLSERLPGPNQPPPRLWIDPKEKTYYPRRNTGQAFYLNCGTIPKETSYRVYDERTRRNIGDLSRDFGERLYERDVILLGSKPYRITAFSGSRIFVHEELDAQPTVPSWSGEVMPRPFTVASEMMNILKNGCGRRNKSTKGIQVRLDPKGRDLCNVVLKTLEDEDLIPTVERWPVEIIRLNGSRRMYVILLPMGRKVTETLGRVLAYGIRRSIGAKVDYVATDDGFAIVSPKELKQNELVSAFGGIDFKKITKGLVLTSSIFRSRFTHCLNKSLLVLSRFRGKDTGAIYRRNRVEKLLGLVMNCWYSEEGWEGAEGSMKGLIVLAEEALKEVFTERIDIDHCTEMIKGLSTGSIQLYLKDMDSPSILGKGIIRSWKGTLKLKDQDKRAPESELPDKGQMDADLSSFLSNVKLDPSGRSCSRKTMVAFLRELNFPTNDQNNEENIKGLEKMLLVGDHQISLDDIGGSFSGLPFDVRSISGSRRRKMIQKGDLGKVLRWMPFFSHPLELIIRSDDISFHDIRSAFRSGKILPIRVSGEERMSEIGWAFIFRDLIPEFEYGNIELRRDQPNRSIMSRADIGEISERSGEELTEFISGLMNSNIIGKYPKPAKDLLGELGDGYILIPDHDDVDEENDRRLRSLERFLRFFGPFDLTELSRTFGWSIKDIQELIPNGLEKGILDMGIGPTGPMTMAPQGGNGVLCLWIWSPRTIKEFIDQMKIDMEREEFHLLTHTDPGTVLTTKRRIWVDRDRIRGANNNLLLALKGNNVEATISLIETPDLIRVNDIEVDDFDNIGTISSMLVNRLTDYERLGYGAFVIERIMGIPSGEAAEISVEIFLDRGFRCEDTPKGKILVKGPSILKGVTREGILLEMFRSQGLVEGHHWNHPIEVISKLGSVVDRWEILSRIGSSRYRKLKVSEQGPLKKKNDSEWDAVVQITEGISDPPDIEWEDLIAPWGERLSDLKDLTKRFSLTRGMMEQPYPVWSLNQEIERYPPVSKLKIGSIRRPLRELLDKLSSMDPADLGPYLKSHKHKKEVEEILRAGLITEDGWGGVRIRGVEIEPNKVRSRTMKKVTRGLLQRYWLIRWARKLSIFSMEDLINYSPEFVDQGKIRMMMKEMVGTSLDQYLMVGSGVQVVYSIKGLDMKRVRNIPGPETFREMIVISPKDRMSRVISYDIRGTIARGHGFSIFKGGRAIALVSIKKLARPVKNTEFGENIHGSTSLEYWSVKKAWVDLRYKRSKLLKSIRKAFYTLGYQLINDDEKLKLESLYREYTNNKINQKKKK